MTSNKTRLVRAFLFSIQTVKIKSTFNYAGGVMTEKKKSAGGRPSSYKKEYAEQAKNLCLLGATDEFMANFFGVAVSTLNNWKLNHPEFLEALKAGKEFADAHVAQSLYKRATGYVTKETKIASFEGRITDTLDVDKYYPPDTTAAIFWLKNRRPDLWRDKPAETDDSGNMAEILSKLIDKLPS